MGRGTRFGRVAVAAATFGALAFGAAACADEETDDGPQQIGEQEGDEPGLGDPDDDPVDEGGAG